MSEFGLPEELKLVPRWVWENWEKLPSRFKQIVGAFRGRRLSPNDPVPPLRRILIIGPGGTGKSTLGRLLSGQHLHLLLEDPTAYEQTADFEELTLLDDSRTALIVSPGQATLRPSQWSDVIQQVTAGEFDGIIFTAANGYHSFPGVGYRNHPSARPTVSEFLKVHTAESRAQELAVFAKLQPAVAAAAGKLWMMILVTKEDLWWRATADGTKAYREDGWKALIDATAASRGPDRFEARVVGASFHIGCFRDARGRVLKKNTAGYDQREQVGSVRGLVDALGQLLDWGA